MKGMDLLRCCAERVSEGLIMPGWQITCDPRAWGPLLAVFEATGCQPDASFIALVYPNLDYD
jgi:hypothetical protein